MLPDLGKDPISCIPTESEYFWYNRQTRHGKGVVTKAHSYRIISESKTRSWTRMQNSQMPLLLQWGETVAFESHESSRAASSISRYQRAKKIRETFYESDLTPIGKKRVIYHRCKVTVRVL